MQSTAATVEQYLADLPPDRREAIAALRGVILKNIDPAIREGMQYGMIGYYVPHERFPDGYHCDPRQPLPFAGLASQKNHLSVYLFHTYDGSAEALRLRQEWVKAGKKLDMGKCCIRFKKLEDVPLEVLGEALRRMPVDKFIRWYEAMRDAPRPGRPAKKATARKAAVKRAATKEAASKKAASKKRAAPKAPARPAAKKKRRTPARGR